MSDDHGPQTNADADAGHKPVMVGEVLEALGPQPGSTVLDGTVGRAGHARAILRRLMPGGRYVGLDADPANVRFAPGTLAEFGQAFTAHHANFADARAVLDRLGIGRVDGVLADLGFASVQLDDPSRGFSFMHDGPLDMRLDPTAGYSAADLVAELDERSLADLIYRFGEERLSRPISRKIVAARRDAPIKTTRRLADIVAAAYGGRAHRQRIHPATRTFQALRIAVNDELGRLGALLERLPDLLVGEGRAVIISFHSLEDRMVKQAFRKWSDAGRAELLSRKPLRPTEAERAANPRSRSAKLRGLRWIEHAM